MLSTKKLNTWLCLIPFVIYACSFSNDTENTEKLIHKDASFVLELDSVSQPQTNYLEKIKLKTEEYFVCFNQLSNSLDFYAFVSKKLANRIIFPKDGADTFGKIIAVKMLPDSTCFVLNSKELIVWDLKTNERKKISIQNILNEGTPYAVFPSQGLIFDNNKVYFQISPNGDFQNSATYLSAKTLAFVDINTSELGFLPIKYPIDYQEKSPLRHDAYFHSAYIPESRKIVLSFPLSDNLFAYDLKINKQEVITSKSEKIKIERKKADDNPNNAYLLSDEYFNLFVTEKGTLLRFCRKGLESLPKENAPIDKTHFVQIFDANLKLISEKALGDSLGINHLIQYQSNTFIKKNNSEDEWVFVQIN
jgi:hypothetical protein